MRVEQRAQLEPGDLPPATREAAVRTARAAVRRRLDRRAEAAARARRLRLMLS